MHRVITPGEAPQCPRRSRSQSKLGERISGHCRSTTRPARVDPISRWTSDDHLVSVVVATNCVDACGCCAGRGCACRHKVRICRTNPRRRDLIDRPENGSAPVHTPPRAFVSPRHPGLSPVCWLAVDHGQASVSWSAGISHDLCGWRGTEIRDAASRPAVGTTAPSVGDDLLLQCQHGVFRPPL